MNLENQETKPDLRLVGATVLLEILFQPETRPSVRWVLYQAARKTIPSFKIGRLLYFDPVRVREAIEQRCLVAAKPARKAKKAGAEL